MTQIRMYRTPPPGADDSLFDLAQTYRAYHQVWMAMVRYGAQTDPHWLRTIVRNQDVLSVLAVLRQRPKDAPAIADLIAKTPQDLCHNPVWMHLIGIPEATAHGALTLAARPMREDAQWNAFVDFAMRHMPRRTSHYTNQEPKMRAWRSFLDMPSPHMARQERQVRRQAARGRIKGPKGGTQHPGQPA